MPPSERARLVHMLEAARDVATFVRDRSRHDLENDRMLRRALIQCFEVIGEAASHVSTDTRAKYPDIPWRAARGMRNVIAHTYFAINLDVLWDTAMTDTEPLISALEQTLAELDSSGA
jgi:uncharacterized protein with HEPN domain